MTNLQELAHGTDPQDPDTDHDGIRDGAEVANGLDTALKAFCLALRQGKQGEGAFEALRVGRSYEELEEQITKAWRDRGVKFTFR